MSNHKELEEIIRERLIHTLYYMSRDGNICEDIIKYTNNAEMNEYVARYSDAINHSTIAKAKKYKYILPDNCITRSDIIQYNFIINRFAYLADISGDYLFYCDRIKCIVNQKEISTNQLNELSETDSIMREYNTGRSRGAYRDNAYEYNKIWRNLTIFYCIGFCLAALSLIFYCGNFLNISFALLCIVIYLVSGIAEWLKSRRIYSFVERLSAIFIKPTEHD